MCPVKFTITLSRLPVKVNISGPVSKINLLIKGLNQYNLLERPEVNKIWNPLLDIYLANGLHLDPFQRFEIDPFKDVNHSPSRKYNMNRIVKNDEIVQDARRRYSWAVPDEKLAKAILDVSGPEVVEMAAGTGYWAHYLEQFDIDVLAYDIQSKRDGYCTPNTYYHEVLEGDYSILDNHSGRALLLCWPPYDISYAYDCLMAYKGNYLIYIGEGHGGCCADNAFFEELDKNWDVVYTNYDTINWWFVHSYDVIYKRKGMPFFHEEEIY